MAPDPPLAVELLAGVHVSYLAEGGANIVYRIITQKNANPSRKAQFEGKLLRLRKDIESGIPYMDTARNFDEAIRPLFRPTELVDQELIRLPRGLAIRLSQNLVMDEKAGRRPKRRHDVYLSPAETSGLLITDMTVRPGSKDTLAEFKPKWLVQSPTAPPGAKRCRTCALREMKNHEARAAGGKEYPSFCPLDLVSDKFEDVLRATRLIKGGGGNGGRTALARLLYQNSTLLKLQAYQRQNNAVGLNGPPPRSREGSIAMTLRDCTMFIKMPHNEHEKAEVRLGDLDQKTATGGKAQYWRELETRLIEGGWYTGRHDQDSECALSSRRPCD